MVSLFELFRDDDPQPAALSQALRAACISDSEREALRAILKHQWDRLRKELVGADAKTAREWRAWRGYVFEKLIFKLLSLEGLNPSPSYYAHLKQPGSDEPTLPKRRGRSPGGEQIDGSFELDNKYFLLEAKWREPMTPSDLYAFRGRVDGKLVGTIGVIISAPGFVEDAEYALLWGKEVNVLLVNGDDVRLALEQGNSFREMMRAKLREAARVGRLFYLYAEHLDKRGD